MLLAPAKHEPGISLSCPAPRVLCVAGRESSLHARWCLHRATAWLCCSNVLSSLLPPLLQSVSEVLIHCCALQGSYVKYLTKTKAYSQIAMRLLTGARKNRFVAED